MIICRSRHLMRGEVWFDHEPGNSRVDWILYLQRSQAVPGSKWKYCRTLLIDIEQDPAELLRQMKKDAVYRIRRARDKDETVCACCNASDPKVMDEFEAMYNRFAVLKGLAPLDRARLQSIATSGLLELSVARDSLGTPLVYHANVRDGFRASQLFSVSLYRDRSDNAARNMINRANCYLVWSDLLRFREQGLKCADFGGWFHGKLTPEMQNINQFKLAFGGRVIREYQCEQIRTLKGWLVLRAASLFKQLKTVRTRATAASDPSEPNVSSHIQEDMAVANSVR